MSECVATAFLGAAAAGASKVSGEVCGAGDGLAAGMAVGTGLGVGVAAVVFPGAETRRSRCGCCWALTTGLAERINARIRKRLIRVTARGFVNIML